MATLEQEINSLASRVIDHTKCTPSTSLHQQIAGSIGNQKAVLTGQIKQFDLGNGQTFQDPFLAAEELLKREYGETFLFDSNRHDPIFIPEEFMCSQYSRECATANLDPNIMGQLKKVLNNLKEQSPDDWFTKDLDQFLQTQTTTEINQTEYDKWIFNAKVMYLVTQEHDIQRLNLPSTTSSQFIPALDNIKPKSPLLNILVGKNKKAKVDKRIAKLPPQDPRLSYCFNLNLNECGEKTERSIFEKLISLKNNETLQDIVVLSSPNFMTEVTSKKHQEFDMLIFSWTRKLIIGVEVKRTLTNNTTAFEQLTSTIQYSRNNSVTNSVQGGHLSLFYV
ncbi:uncharacterized protein [Clytia hemisphaerica]|uniref:uncharacterized protein isoform X2 n=1 Tax=Clytia hemisphaerica TaxID=252671 RepID=UPI0034D3BE42